MNKKQQMTPRQREDIEWILGCEISDALLARDENRWRKAKELLKAFRDSKEQK